MKDYYERISKAKRIVVKVGSSTLTHKDGGLNLRKMDKLTMVLSDLSNQGKEIILVTSGAVAAGSSKLGLTSKVKTTKEKQAVASIGQCELMFIYDKMFSQYSKVIGQMLLTKSITTDEVLKNNTINTIETLFTYHAIPIINENDTIAIDEIVYGDNDTLSAVTASLVKADVLILLSDIDGMFTDNPQTNKNAKLIPVVKDIDYNVESMAKDTVSKVGTGGMSTKVSAAKIATDAGCDMIIANGKDPEILYDILDGKPIGTLFIGKGE